MNDRGDSPIACTLQGGSYQERLAWIADLARDGLRSHSRQDLMLDLRYAPEVAGLVRDMVRKEQDCCAFLEFELTETSDEVRLTITAPERAREVANLLFDQFVSPGTGIMALTNTSIRTRTRSHNVPVPRNPTSTRHEKRS